MDNLWITSLPNRYRFALTYYPLIYYLWAMSSKPVTCRTCGTPNLSWRQSAKGNWYLYDPVTVPTTYGGNYVIPKAHLCLMPLYDEQGRKQGSIPARDFDQAATVAAITKRIAKLEFQQSLDAVDDDDLAELAELRHDLAKFQG